MTGTIVNSGAIVVGALLGSFLKKGLDERYQESSSKVMGVFILFLGIQMSLKTENLMLAFLSLMIGTFIGELLKLDERFKRSCDRIMIVSQQYFSKFGTGNDDCSKGFITASILFCVGAMGIIGSIEDSLNGNPSILYVKATLDGVSALIFASNMGFSIALSAIAVLLYQGTITLLAGELSTILTTNVLNEVSGIGGIMLIALALNLLRLQEIKIVNWLPAIPLLVIIVKFIL